MVRGEFGINAKNFFINNNICTPDGIFAISDQFYDVLSGNYGNGEQQRSTHNSFRSMESFPKRL